MDPIESSWSISSNSIPHGYEALHVLGEGGFGKVIKCRNRSTKDIVAIKIFKTYSKFSQEGNILGVINRHRLDRYNIVKCLEIDTFYLVFETLDITLGDYIMYKQSTNCIMSLEDVRSVIEQMARAFKALKMIGVIHTDVKVDNIMIVNRFRLPLRVKLIDFGLAMYRLDAKTGMELQKAQYRSPEILLGLPFSEAIDIWSLGCVMASMLLNCFPFQGRDSYETLRFLVDLLGPPPRHLLKAGQKTFQFFKETSSRDIILMTPQECNQSAGFLSNTFFLFPFLDTMKTIRLESHNKTEADQRNESTELVKEMFNWDGRLRITPNGILNHPFITKSYLNSSTCSLASSSDVAVVQPTAPTYRKPKKKTCDQDMSVQTAEPAAALDDTRIHSDPSPIVSDCKKKNCFKRFWSWMKRKTTCRCSSFLRWTYQVNWRLLITIIRAAAVGAQRLSDNMFSWGEDGARGFRLDSDPGPPTADGLHHLKLTHHITHLSAGHNVLAFVKRNGNSFIIRTNETKDGRRVRGKQKYVKCKEKIEAVSCADDVVTLLSDRGQLLCVDTTRSFSPRPLDALGNIPVSQVACGGQHSVALTRDGQVYTWGQDSRGQLGLGKTKPGASSPQHLRSLSGIPLVQIAAGGEQSFALSVSGGVFGWGRNHRGQLGLGDTDDRPTPTPVHCLNMKKTTHISCGTDHTAILTKDGAVFTFGSSQYGQLGHNSFRDELRPRIVAELWGAKVTKIACGRHHTLVLTDSKKVYSFGCGEQGQLGRGEESHPSVPLPVQLPQETTNDLIIGNIFAGGNCSFATCTFNEDVHEEANNASVNVSQHCLDEMIDKWTSEWDPKSWKKIKQEIHRMFSSASCLNTSFLQQSKDKHFHTSPKYSGLNLSLARLAFKKLVKKDSVVTEVEAAILHLLPSLDTKPVGVEGLRIYLLLNELLYVTQRHNKQQTSLKLAEAVAAAVINLSADSLQVLGDWWSSLPSSTMVKHVKVWKRAFSVILSSKPVPRNRGVKNLLLVLQYMCNANSRTAEPRRMPERDFCLLMDINFLHEDLQLWRSRSQRKNVHAEPLILCSFPTLMDLESKKFVFDLNAEYTKKEANDRMNWEPIFDFECLYEYLYFELDLRRTSVLEDTFQELAVADHRLYKLPLMVYFDENYTIDQVSRKDFFYEVFHEMVSAASEMFMFNDSKTLAWFPSTATPEDRRYFHFGFLCGLAFYNQCIIHLPFPLTLFKKLLGVKPSLEDMMEFSPCVGESLLNILEDYQDDDIESLYMDFLISWDGTEVDLDPKNPNKPVTGQNKKEFVDAYVNHAFNISVEGVFQEFKRGFFQVCDRDLVKLFRPKELQEVLVGTEFHEWEKLKQNTGYEGVYNTAPPHPTIQMFWEVFDELTEDQKITFLWFVTGFERLPIGLENLKMTIRDQKVQDLSYDKYYPETHTCFSKLDLPLYSTKEIMQTKLTEALSNKKNIYK